MSVRFAPQRGGVVLAGVSFVLLCLFILVFSLRGEGLRWQSRLLLYVFIRCSPLFLVHYGLLGTLLVACIARGIEVLGQVHIGDWMGRRFGN